MGTLMEEAVRQLRRRGSVLVHDAKGDRHEVRVSMLRDPGADPSLDTPVVSLTELDVLAAMTAIEVRG